MIKKHKDLTTGSIKSHLFQLAYPMAFGFFAHMTFNVVDTYFVSYLGKEALAAMGFVFPIVMIMMGVFFGISVGLSSIVGKAFGEKNYDKVVNYVTNTYIFNLFLIILIASLNFIYMDELLYSLGATKDVIPLLKDYLTPWIIGLPFMGFMITSEKIMQAMGDSKTPSRLMITASIINMIMDPILIFGWFGFPELGIAGASLSTLIGRAVCTIYALRYIYKAGLISFKQNIIKDFFKDIKDVTRLAFPIMFNSITMNIVFIALNKAIAVFGTIAVGAVSIAIKIEGYMIIFYIVIGAAMTAFSAQNYGAKQYKRINKALNYNLIYDIAWCIISFLFYLLFAKYLIGIFNKEAIYHGYTFLIVSSISYFALGLIYSTHSLFNALHKPNYSLVFTTIQTVLQIATIMIASKYLDFFGIVLSLAIVRIIIGSVLFVTSKKLVKSL